MEIPKWPKALPNGWVLGPIAGVATDGVDHVWALHDPRRAEAGATTAPPVIEFDAEGDVVQAWGGPGEGYDWPIQPQAISVDSAGHVWISGIGSGDRAAVLGFTRKGTFVSRTDLQGTADAGQAVKWPGSAAANDLTPSQPVPPRHSLAVDRRGNFYTTDVGGHLRKFAYKGPGDSEVPATVFDPSKPKNFDSVDNECHW